MLKLFSRAAPPPRSEVGVMVRSDLTVHTRPVRQTQILTEHYVLTEAGRAAVLFWAERRQRFTVDRARRQLTPVDAAAERARAARLRALIGEVIVERGEAEEEIGRFRCRRVAVRNGSSAVVVEGELHVARVPELAATSLRAEREYEAGTQPFHLPLAADELVVRSRTRTLGPGFEQRQTGELHALELRVPALAELDEILTYRVVA